MPSDKPFVPEDVLDAIFGGLDTALFSVDTALKNARINADLSGVRQSIHKAGKTASDTVRHARTMPVPTGTGGLFGLLRSLLRRCLPPSLQRLFFKDKTPPIQENEEDLPFVEEPPAPAPETVPAEPIVIPRSSDPATDAAIGEQCARLLAIEDAATDIYRYRPKTAVQLENILNIYRRILAALAERPKKLADLRRFTGYYIPTLLKFTQTYAALCVQAKPPAAARQTMAEIETAFAQIEEGFRKKLDDMFSSDALDIAADVSVVDSMLDV